MADLRGTGVGAAVGGPEPDPAGHRAEGGGLHRRAHPAAGAAAPAAEEKTDFDVVLTGFDAAQKIKVIKVIREVMGLGLAEAKAAVEGAPTTMKEGLSKEDAEALKKQVEEVGGKVELK